jgi:hypothetical protein
VEALFPRPLSARERSLLDFLLAEDFPGAEALRMQAQTVRVKGLWEGLPSVVLLEVADGSAPRANVLHTVPVEAKVRDVDPPQELLLFVENGFLDSIELVDYSGSDEAELPLAAALEPPTAKSGSAPDRLQRGE